MVGRSSGGFEGRGSNKDHGRNRARWEQGKHDKAEPDRQIVERQGHEDFRVVLAKTKRAAKLGN